MDQAAAGQGSNSSVLRQYNQRMILTALRRLGEASKSDLGRHVRLTANAAGQIVTGLKQQHLVIEAGRRVGQRGQPATLLQLDPRGAYSIGVKLGRRSLDSILVDFSGTVLRARRVEGPLRAPEDVLRTVREDVAALLSSVAPRDRGRVAGVGLAMPYNLGSWRRELDIPEAVCAAWNGYDLGSRLRATLDLPVLVENDGTAVAVAELFGGCGRELDDFAVIYIAAAVGGGLVLGGACRRGATGNAGDIGLMPVGPSTLASAPPPAAGTEILLARASVNALIRHLGLPQANAALIAQAIEAAPERLAEWIEDAAQALMGPVLSIASVLDVQAVVLDGVLPRPVMGRLLDRLRALLASNVPEARTPPVLRLGTHGSNAAAIGAATLPLQTEYGMDRDLLFAPAGGHP